MNSQPATVGRKIGLIDQVAATLRERIVSGHWPIGTRIPTEPELTKLTGAGRNTVREAVQSLVHSGMLERRQGSGTYVVATSELAKVMTRQFAAADQRDVLEVRRALEVRAAELAALRRTPADIEMLYALQADRATAVAAEDLDRMVDADLEIHRAIAQVSGNQVLAEIYDNLLDAVMENIRFNFQNQVHAADSHLALLQAIEAGDIEAAHKEIELYLDEMLAAVPEDEW